MYDITVVDTGSIVLLQPNTSEAVEWIDENIGKDNGFQPDYPTVLCEPRYAQDIMYEMQNDMLTLEDRDGRGFTLQPVED